MAISGKPNANIAYKISIVGSLSKILIGVSEGESLIEIIGYKYIPSISIKNTDSINNDLIFLFIISPENNFNTNNLLCATNFKAFFKIIWYNIFVI